MPAAIHRHSPWRYAPVLLAACTLAARAELAAPNAAGVAMGHLHYFVDDVTAHRDFWVRLGGSAAPFAAGEAVRMPGVVILISELAADSAPATIDHVAFRVASLDDIESRGFALERLEAFPGIASIRTPSGDRVELFEEGTATNVGFEPAVAAEDAAAPADALAASEDVAVALRHNRPLAGGIDSHHLHFYLPAAEVEAARDWYVDHFGAVPGLRWRYAAADLPGMNLNFSAADAERMATRGRTLDHIGFEVSELEDFCAALAARGVVFDQAYRRVSADFALAVLTDPWGTTIELTEGLGNL